MTSHVKIGTTTRGKDAVLSPVAATLWGLTVPLVKERLGIDLSSRIIQAYGDAAASAGTHGSPAAAVDIRIWNLSESLQKKLVLLLRECGWAATWRRVGSSWKNNEHIHAATDIGEWTPARYQVTAVKAGYNGLGSAGRGGKDEEARPSQWRTAKEGIAWIPTQVKEEDMPLNEQDLAKIAAAVWAAGFGSAEETAGKRLALASQNATLAASRTADIRRFEGMVSLRQEVADSKTMLLKQEGQMSAILEMLKTIAEIGPSVDMTLLVSVAEKAARTAVGDALQVAAEAV